MGAPIHWHEGLFLQPHHLQAMQRWAMEGLAGERRLRFAYPYGVVDWRHSPDELENFRVRFDRLHVVMPSGLEVRLPENAEVPALDIKQAFTASSGGLSVSLGVPLYYSQRANTVTTRDEDDWRIKRQWRVAEEMVPDENTGENPQPVQVRHVNARLLLEGDDRTDLEVLPLLRIVQSKGEDVGLPRLDPAYIPPCLVVSGSPRLREMIRDIANGVDAKRKEQVIKLTKGGFAVENLRGVEFQQLLRLRTLNRVSARLMHLVRAPGTTPFEVYLELRDLVGELAALQPDRDMFEVASYDHDRLGISFTELEERWRELGKSTGGPGGYGKVEFMPEGGVWVAVLSEGDLSQANEYFLAIKTKTDPRALAALVEDGTKFKFMSKKLVAALGYGVKLAEERHAPLQLPAESGLHYFRLLRADSQRMWSMIEQERAIGVKWTGGEGSDFKLSLYYTKVS